MRHALIVLHLLAAIAVLIVLTRHLGSRAQDVSDLRAIADRERSETESMRVELARQQLLLEGRRQQDPYVIELLARQRLGYIRPGEYTPPPMPQERRAAPLTVDR